MSDAAVDLPLRIRIWPVEVKVERPFHVRGYCGGFPVWAGGYQVTDENLRRLQAILRLFADIGGDVLDWNCAWREIVARAKIADSGDYIWHISDVSAEGIDHFLEKVN